MYLSLLSLVVLAALWLYRDHRQSKQIRCLRYCFIDMTDWLHARVSQIRDEQIEWHGQASVHPHLVNFERDFEKHLEYERQLMRRAGMDPLVREDRLYAEEDIRIGR